MRKLFLLCAVCLSMICVQVHAQKKELGYFNSVAIGANIGTTGWGVDLATPIGKYFALRAGVTIMPNYSMTEEVDVTLNGGQYNYEYETSMDIEGSIGRISNEVLLNIYPFTRSSFFLTGGAAFSGDKLIKLKGHSAELEELQSKAENAGIEIGDYIIPVDKKGYVSGGIKVSSFRPYLGLGFGRIVPKKRVGFLFELGFQFHKTPEVYTEYGSISNLLNEADNEFTDIMNQLTVYPVIRFRLCGRLF